MLLKHLACSCLCQSVSRPTQ